MYNNERPFSQWAIHIQTQLDNHAQSGRSIHRADIKWPKGRKVSSHFAVESDTSSDLQQTEGEQQVYTSSI
jgi:hypothetical protein